MEVGVRLLGAPEAYADGAWLPLTPTRPHAVLAYLAVHGGLVRRCELAALLWPEADRRSAQSSLRQVVARLHHGAFSSLIGRDRTGLWCRCDSDVGRFRRAVGERRWADAFALHEGPLLYGFEIDADEYAAWLAGQRAAVAEDWARACRALMSAAAAAGRHADAERYADLLVRADPFDEQAVRGAMLAAAEAGDRRGVARHYEALVTLLEREMSLAPEPETQALWAHLAARDEARPGAEAPTTSAPAPVRLTGERRGVIGRESAVADLMERLRDRQMRLVTLLGPGGIGKTSLAGALVAELATSRCGVARIVPLAGARGEDAVAFAIAQAFGVALTRGAAVVPQLAGALEGRRALVVLDGFETHLAQLASVDALLRATSDLRLLVTSRVRLHHSLETVVEVAPLATRDPGRRDRSAVPGSGVSPAAQLFLRTAALRLPLHTVRRLDLEAVERVVAALGGHPLAIEIAASWLDVLDVEGLETQLQASWAPLQSDDVDRPVRRRDVHEVLQEAWDTLSPVGRDAWERLALMPGTLDPWVASEVCGHGWRGLRQLLDRAVLRHDGPRLALHPLLARFGGEHAREDGLEKAAWAAALRVWRSRLGRPVDPRSGRRVRLHPDDLEQALGAWRWALAAGALGALADMAVGLSRALDERGRWREADDLSREAVERLLAARGRERDVALARLWPQMGQTLSEKRAHAASALRLAEARGDDLASAHAHAWLAHGAFTPDRAAHVRAARAAFERAGDAIGLARLLVAQGGASVLAGRQAHGAALLDEAHERFGRLADADGLALVHAKRGRLALYRGDLAAARAETRTARDLTGSVGLAQVPSFVLEVDAEIALTAGAADEAMESIVAYLRALGTRADTGYDELVMRTRFHLRFGPAERLREVAGAWAVHEETIGGRLIHRMLANAYLAIAHARLGAPAQGRAPLALAVRLARPLEVPRIVAAIAVAAAAVAAARRDGPAARRLCDLALRHPSLEHALRREAEAVRAELADRGAGDDGDDDRAHPDDAAILDEVEGWLVGWAAPERVVAA